MKASGIGGSWQSPKLAESVATAPEHSGRPGGARGARRAGNTVMAEKFLFRPPAPTVYYSAFTVGNGNNTLPCSRLSGARPFVTVDQSDSKVSPRVSPPTAVPVSIRDIV